FAQGKVWDSPEAQRSAGRPAFTGEKRNADWRPGGAHKDPRDRFKKKNRPERAWSEKDPATQRDRDKLAGPPRSSRDWPNKTPRGAAPPRGDRPWQKKQPDVPQTFNPPPLVVDPNQLRRDSTK